MLTIVLRSFELWSVNDIHRMLVSVLQPATDLFQRRFSEWGFSNTPEFFFKEPDILVHIRTRAKHMRKLVN